MPTLITVALVAVLVVALLFGGVWYSRTRTISHRVGSFRCAVGRQASGPWSAGVAQYGAENLYWWRHWSLAPRALHRWPRRGLAVLERVDVGDGNVVVTCQVAGCADLFLLMSREAYGGLTSWIEATPSRIDSVI